MRKATLVLTALFSGILGFWLRGGEHFNGALQFYSVQELMELPSPSVGTAFLVIDEDEQLRSLKDSWLACTGQRVHKADWPELAEAVGSELDEKEEPSIMVMPPRSRVFLLTTLQRHPGLLYWANTGSTLATKTRSFLVGDADNAITVAEARWVIKAK